MTVTPQGRGIYRVDKFTVDLRAWRWNGSCTCLTFTGCALFVLTNQTKDTRQRCQHILAAREWVMENEVPNLIDRAEKIVELTNESINRFTDRSEPSCR